MSDVDATPMASTGRKLLAASTLMAAGSLVSRVLGLVRNVLLAAVLSQDKRQADMFAVAIGIPTALYYLFAGGTLNTVLVPQITRAIRKDGDNGTAFVNRIMTAFGTFTLAVTVIAMLAARPLVWIQAAAGWRAPELSAHFDNMVLLTLLMMPQLFFWGVFFMAGQVLNALDRFGPMSWAPVANNVVQIAMLAGYGMVWGTHTDHSVPFTTQQAWFLALGTTLAVAAQAAIMVVYLTKAGFRFRPRFDLRGTGLGHTVAVAKWVLATVVVGQLATFLLNRINSGGTVSGEGAGLSVYGNAFLLFMLPHGLITVSLTTALLPLISRLADDGDLDGVRRETTRALKITATIMVPAAIAMAVLSKPIATVIYGHGAGASGVPAVAWTLVAYCVGLPLFTAIYVLTRTFFAMEDTKTTFWLNVIYDVVNVALALVLVNVAHGPRWIAPATALAYSLAHVPVLPLWFRAVGRHVEGIRLSDTIRHWVRVGLATAPAAAAAWACTWLGDRVSTSLAVQLLALGVAAAVGLALFYVGARVLHLTEVTDIVALLTTRLRGRRSAPPAAVSDATAQQAAEPERDDPLTLDTAVAAEALTPERQAGTAASDESTMVVAEHRPAAHAAVVPAGPTFTAAVAPADDEDLDEPAAGATDATAVIPAATAATVAGSEDDADATSTRVIPAVPATDRTTVIPAVADAPAAQLAEGQVLAGRYRLDEHLATRGGALTWRAFDLVLSRPVLVHALAPADEREGTLLMAARRAAAATDSRYLRVLDAVPTRNSVGGYVVAEYVPGASLEVLLQQGPLSALEAGWIVRELADALVAMHAQGLHHGRLDLDTVVISSTGNVKMVGFMTEAALHPEDGDDERPDVEWEARDVESLGKILYALLVARWPGGPRFSLPDAPRSGEGWLSPREVRAGVSPALDQVCDRILSRPPRDGYHPLRTANDVALALTRILGTADAAPDLESRLRRPVVTGQPTRHTTSMDSALTRPSADSASSASERTVAVPVDPVPFTPVPAPRHRPTPADVPDAEPVGAVEPVAPTPAHLAPAAPRRDRGRPALIALIGLALLALIIGSVATYAKLNPGALRSTSTTAGAPATSPRPTVPVAKVVDFDPEGSRSENTGEVALAVDGNAATAWHTERYPSARPATLAGVPKTGVGLVLDLGTATDVRGVALQLTGQPTGVQVLVAPAAATSAPMDAVASWARVAGADAAGTTADLTFSATTRFVLVLVTSMPGDATNGYQAALNEVQVLR